MFNFIKKKISLNAAKRTKAVRKIGMQEKTGETLIDYQDTMADQTNSPNLADSRNKSIPIQKAGSLSQLKTVPEKEEKLDKLPPVPPSSWSSRRNQPQFASTNSANRTNSGQRRQNNKTPTNQTELNETNEQLRQQFYNGHDLNIQESGITSSFDDDSTHSTSTQKSDSTLQSINNNNNDNNSTTKKVNYDNFKVSENNSDSDVEERVEVTITKDSRFKDFGFSISDNFFGSGILVNKVRGGSPAEESSYMKPFTQIFKINNIDCTKLDCSQVSSVLSNEQSNTMRLVVSAKPKRLSLSNDLTLSERKMNLQNAYAISSSRATAL